ncbi:bifunctional phosphopantothenoylcysteine decarboxylase/phosphopantothenate--cysteine ligase CoaBC [Betaproteobacteria bacterium LSUCC0115]|nr:bifunctional phosphopantothenoylcysteine decarboxylase/phosphopantothenate--cysteine ligase CoaBC [Burkholderiales bacterium LSUCC0115]
MSTPVPDQKPTKRLDGCHLVLGVTGGIAAYKACELVRRLQDLGASVQVVMTEGAKHFVTETTFQALSGRPVISDQWTDSVQNGMPHIDLARESDGIVVAPASADFLAKLCHGQTDELLLSLCLARDVPLWVAPAMNRQMWENPVTQDNIRLLGERGIRLIGPDQGEQACGEVGLGRMVEAEHIAQTLAQEVTSPPTDRVPPVRGRLHGRHVLITAGPTEEPIDPIRVITNRSSGQMGYALARAAQQAGARVTLVSGPVSLRTPVGVARVAVRTAQDMQKAVEEALPADVFIGVAAVADWRVAHPSTEKLKKQSAQGLSDLTWVENPDILAGVASHTHRPALVVGFAAETGTEQDLAQTLPTKLARKQADLLIGNLAVENMHQTHGQFLVQYPDGRQVKLAKDDKNSQALRMVHLLADLLPFQETPS